MALLGLPTGTARHGRAIGSGKRLQPVADTASSMSGLPVGTRRSARLTEKPHHSHVISFPQISDTEDDEDDGVEYDFR